jgi:hypothetical protein
MFSRSPPDILINPGEEVFKKTKVDCGRVVDLKLQCQSFPTCSVAIKRLHFLLERKRDEERLNSNLQNRLLRKAGTTYQRDVLEQEKYQYNL